MIAYKWTFNRVIAVIALTLIFNGWWPMEVVGFGLTARHRCPDYPVFHRRRSDAHWRKHQCLNAGELAPHREHPCGRRVLPLCGLSHRSPGPAMDRDPRNLAPRRQQHRDGRHYRARVRHHWSGTGGHRSGYLRADCSSRVGASDEPLNNTARLNFRSVSEITPVKWRGVTVAVVVFAIVPFMPYLIYVEQLQLASSWRWCFLITGLWNAIALVGLVFCYKPPSRHNIDGLTKMQILKRIDWIGAFLSIGGITLFLVGLNSGGYQYPWTNAKVLAPLIIGGLMLFGAFPVWEWRFAHHPMVPHEIFQGQKVVLLSYLIVFVAGMGHMVTQPLWRMANMYR